MGKLLPALLDTADLAGLLDRVRAKIENVQERIGTMPIFEADKGYDADELRLKLLKRSIFPWICRRKKPGKTAEKYDPRAKPTIY